MIEDLKHQLEQKVQGGSLEDKSNLGEYYFRNFRSYDGQAEVLERAFALLLEASDGGIARASYCIAYIYEAGIGRVTDLKSALRYYQKAALFGFDQAFYEVGRMYFYGLGVEVDEDLADIWLGKAESLGIPLDDPAHDDIN